jgi:hypothetical protein
MGVSHLSRTRRGVITSAFSLYYAISCAAKWERSQAADLRVTQLVDGAKAPGLKCEGCYSMPAM